MLTLVYIITGNTDIPHVLIFARWDRLAVVYMNFDKFSIYNFPITRTELVLFV